MYWKVKENSFFILFQWVNYLISKKQFSQLIVNILRDWEAAPLRGFFFPIYIHLYILSCVLCSFPEKVMFLIQVADNLLHDATSNLETLIFCSQTLRSKVLSYFIISQYNYPHISFVYGEKATNWYIVWILDSTVILFYFVSACYQQVQRDFEELPPGAFHKLRDSLNVSDCLYLLLTIKECPEESILENSV